MLRSRCGLCARCNGGVNDLSQNRCVCLAVVGLEVDQMAMHAYLHQLNSNYTKVIWDMNDSATAAIGNSTLQCRKQHDKLRERLKLINTVQTTLNRTVVNISRRVEALHGRMGELVRELREKSDLDQHRHYTWLTSPVRLCG